MSRVRQNGCYRGTKSKADATGNFYYDLIPTNTGVFDTQTIYDSFSGAPTNREGYNLGYGTVSGIPPGTYDFFNTTTTNGTTTPNMNNIYYRRHCLAFTYTAAELQQATGWIPGVTGTIGALEYYATNPVSSSYSPLPNYSIALCHLPVGSTDNTTNPSLTTVGRFGVTTVKNAHSHNITLTGWRLINFDTNFNYNGTDNLGILVGWGQCPTNWTSDGQAYTTNSGTLYFARTDSSGSYNPTTQYANQFRTNARPRIRLTIV